MKADEILNDPIKATLFGKFYEKIVLGWFKEKRLGTPLDGKPRVYWENVDSAKGDCELVTRLNDVLVKYQKEKQFCTPDGLIERGGRYYLWEAKNWPQWTEGKQPLKQLEDLLWNMPFILAKKALYRTVEYNVDGILFSWWSKPKGVESVLQKINNLTAPCTFEIFYTADVIEECIREHYQWYLRIINEEKARIDKLFRDLSVQEQSSDRVVSCYPT